MGSRIQVEIDCECPFYYSRPTSSDSIRTMPPDVLTLCTVLVLEGEGDGTCVGLKDEGCPIFSDEVIVEKKR